MTSLMIVVVSFRRWLSNIGLCRNVALSVLLLRCSVVSLWSSSSSDIVGSVCGLMCWNVWRLFPIGAKFFSLRCSVAVTARVLAGSCMPWFFELVERGFEKYPDSFCSDVCVFDRCCCCVAPSGWPRISLYLTPASGTCSAYASSSESRLKSSNSLSMSVKRTLFVVRLLRGEAVSICSLFSMRPNELRFCARNEPDADEFNADETPILTVALPLSAFLCDGADFDCFNACLLNNSPSGVSCVVLNPSSQ